jgi:putative Mn2+ efflux pump MntP
MTSVWVLLSTAIALAMDALAVAIATGLHLKRVSLRQTFRLSWHFGLFQALMPIAGSLPGVELQARVRNFDHWIAFMLLVAVGSKMILEAVRHAGRSRRPSDPTRGTSLVMLSVATSIDALAVGFSLSLLGVSIWWPAVLIGITAAAFTAAGLHLGCLLSGASSFDRYAEMFGGLVLIIIGLAILREHGVF